MSLKKPALQILINERSKTESSIYDEALRKSSLSRQQPFCFSPSVKSDKNFRNEMFSNQMLLQKGFSSYLTQPSKLSQGHHLKLNSPLKTKTE